MGLLRCSLPLICYCSQTLLADRAREYRHVFIHINTHEYIYFYIYLYKHIFGTKSSQLLIPIQHGGIHSSFFPFHMYKAPTVKNLLPLSSIYLFIRSIFLVTNLLPLPVPLTVAFLPLWALIPCTRLPSSTPLWIPASFGHT